MAAGCHLLEIDAEHCPLPSALAAPGAQLCLSPGWLLSLTAVVLLGTLGALALLRRMLRWLSLRDGSRAVAVAAEVAAELRRALPAAYPPARHAFAPAPPGAAADALSPLLCGVCRGGIALGSAAAGSLQGCPACGLLAHHGCVRRAGKDCRPLCCAAPSLPHFWLPAGMTLEVADEVGAALPRFCLAPVDTRPARRPSVPARLPARQLPYLPCTPRGITALCLPPLPALQLPEGSFGSSCLYCREPAELGGDSLAPPEPLWRCSLCAAVCHVACFCEAHSSSLPTVAAKLRALLAGSSSGEEGQRGGQLGAAPRQPAAAGAAPAEGRVGTPIAGRQNSSSSGSSDVGARSARPQVEDGGAARAAEEAGTAAGAGAQSGSALRRRHGGPAGGQLPRPRSAGWLQALAGAVGAGSAAPSSGSDSGYSSDSESGEGSRKPDPPRVLHAQPCLRARVPARHGSTALAAAGAGHPCSALWLLWRLMLRSPLCRLPLPADAPYDARLQRQRWQRRRRRHISSLDVARLDECTLGPLR